MSRYIDDDDDDDVQIYRGGGSGGAQFIGSYTLCGRLSRESEEREVGYDQRFPRFHVSSDC